ncbi:MAG TPA: hypothetical protein DCP02_02570 [Actinobacteria bacterium]|nr:hypothetical protein [Actinomycetota bacterium]
MTDINKPYRNRFSLESLILGIISVLSDLALFLMMPGKTIGPNIIEPIDPEEQFLRYALILFMLMLLGVVAAGTSIVAIIAGIKDYMGIDRGLYIEKGRGIYIAGFLLGVSGILFLIGFLMLLSIS